MFMTIVIAIQLIVTLIMGLYFYRQLRVQKGDTPVVPRASSAREMEHLTRKRAIHLAEPLNEQVRPAKLSDIVGQEEGVKALKAILCGTNPQHVIIYGPPGVGKTCAARLVLEHAKNMQCSPFVAGAPFIEMDATCVRFDERSIADPLIGSVHDPIYQGAGQLGISGVPQPKEGAVTKAHGGVLFLDEIGELHPVQMNKLLKVLEDRKVMFESAYYNPDDTSVPRHIREIFDNGMPADFRLVGATTRSPQDLPAALRSRCMEVYFRALESEELAEIARGAAQKAGYALSDEDAQLIGRHAACGRDAVNIVQVAAGVAQQEERTQLLKQDIEWVLDCGHYAAHSSPAARLEPRVGVVNGLAVQGAFGGAVMEIEAVCLPGEGRIEVTGIIDEEEMGDGIGRRVRRKGTARGSADNVRTVVRTLGHVLANVDLHLNFPGGAPVDGPSAGVAMAVAAISALTGQAVHGDIAMTGEISVRGEVKPVGGVPMKIQAAQKQGLKRVLIPRENWQERYRDMAIEVIPIDAIRQALELAIGEGCAVATGTSAPKAIRAAEGQRAEG